MAAVWSAADKRSYVNIGTFFARHGIVGITANYRLAPEAKWPNGAEDVAGTIKWIKANAAGYGIDADRIFLMGSSAGAVHVSGYAFFEDNQLENDGVAGAILVSLLNVDLVKKAGSKGAVLRSRGEKAYYRDRSRQVPVHVADQHDCGSGHAPVHRLCGTGPARDPGSEPAADTGPSSPG